ncbi:hypothetical protein FLONG3_10060 [Fusarium longipes]|uniref:Uncharacterized protein n=1 Tax=Fusarium longipes TaxID=694270 RepID=A0A395RSB1_9HYPO|nr:hypothetical protein FLONG3_10060 [Fusarium longipes]
MSSPLCPMPLGEIVRDMLGKEKETNPVKSLYHDAFKADIGRWIASCAVIGLAAGIISKNPGQGLLAASAYNLAVGALHFFAVKIPVSPQSMTNPRPPMWYSLILAASTAMWLAALVVMFVKRGDVDAYRDSWLMDNLTIACGCFGVCALADVREGFRKIKKIAPPKDSTSEDV